MPDAAVPALQPIAQFLAIGAPVVADTAVSADFAALLSQQVIDGTATALPEPGKILPAGRQDLAALQLPVVIVPKDLTSMGIEARIDGDAENEDEGAVDQAMPEILFPIFAMLSQPAPVEPVTRSAATPAMPAISMRVAPPTVQPMPEAVAPAATPVDAGQAMPAAKAAPASASIIIPPLAAAAVGIGQAMPASDAVGGADAARPVAAQSATPMNSIAFVMRAAPAAAPVVTAPVTVAAALPAVTSMVDAASPEMPLDVQPVDGKADVAARPVRVVAQPVADARNAAFAMQADPVADVAPRKVRHSADAVAGIDISAMPGAPSPELRGVTAATAASTVDTLPRERAVSLVETIATLRSDVRAGTLDLAIQHDDFGPISIRFEQSDDSVLVRFDTKDADLARLIADATPDLKSAGEPHGMRFERRDTAAGGNGGNANMTNTNMGGSHDAPRQGREPATSRYDPRSPSSPTRDRGGIFA